MISLPRLTRPLLAGALLLCCSAASAAASATGRSAFSHLQLGVIDLAPGDSQAAYYTLLSTDITLSTDVSGDTIGGLQSTAHLTDGTPRTVTSHYAGAATSASTSGALNDIDIRGSLSEDSPIRYANASGTVLYRVSLSPRSALTLGGHVLTFDGRGTGHGSYLYGWARARAFIYGTDAPPYPHPLLEQYSSRWSGNGPEIKDRDFVVALANFSDSPQDLFVRVDSTIYYENRLPVPEPHGYALLLAGLMAAPLLRRRLHSKSQGTL